MALWVAENKPDLLRDVFEVVEFLEGGYYSHTLGQMILTQSDDLGDLPNIVLGLVRAHFEESSPLPMIQLLFVFEGDVSA